MTGAVKTVTPDAGTPPGTVRVRLDAPKPNHDTAASWWSGGLLQNARPEGLGGDDRQARAASCRESGEELPPRGQIRMLCGDHFRGDSILQQPQDHHKATSSWF